MDQRGLQQRREALKKANHSRLYRAKLKQKLKGGEMTLEEVQRVIFDPPPPVQTMPVGKFLRALPTFGRVKGDKALKRIQASAAITLADLSDVQRKQLALLVSTYHRYLLPSSDLPTDQEVTDGDDPPGSNHNRPQRSAA